MGLKKYNDLHDKLFDILFKKKTDQIPSQTTSFVGYVNIFIFKWIKIGYATVGAQSTLGLDPFISNHDWSI